jgi:crossover junction endodeoxyribonuclease RuvC
MRAIELKILGIDPGSIICGFGVIEKDNNKLRVLEYGVIKVGLKNELLKDRLRDIYERLLQVIERNKPDAAVLETVFFSKNVQSLTKLSQARGVALLAAAMSNVDVFEYSPREVKKSVTGRGNAAKEQVQFMVRKILNIEETPEFFDATDALGVALCHSFRMNTIAKRADSWSEYIKQHPEKLINK